MNLPRRKFGTLLVDPPWQFQNQATRAATSNHYKSMSLEALKAMPVPAAPQAHLYLWTTGGHLVDGSATALCEAWDFVPKYLLAWVKTHYLVSELVSNRIVHRVARLEEVPTIKLQIGLGNWFRRNAEWCLFAVKGKAPAAVRHLPDTIFAPRGQHSTKPDIIHRLAETMSPGPRIELFARRPMRGWTTWGDQCSD